MTFKPLRAGRKEGETEVMAGKGMGGKAPLQTTSTRPREALVPDPSPCREAANTGKSQLHRGSFKWGWGWHTTKGLKQQPLLEGRNAAVGIWICKGSHPHSRQHAATERENFDSADTPHCSRCSLLSLFPLPPERTPTFSNHPGRPTQLSWKQP